MDPALLLVFVALGGGLLCARAAVFPANAAETLNKFVVTVSLPCLVLRLVPKLALSARHGALVLAPWVLAAVTAAIVLAVHRVRPFRREVLGALLLCTPLGNTSFLGFPMIGALLGADAVRLAVLYDQLGSFLILATYGVVVVARFSSDVRPGPAEILRRVATFPPFVALVLGLAKVPIPTLLEPTLSRLGDTLVPLALFAVGLRLELRKPRDGGALAFGLGVKMLVAPLVAAPLSHALGANPEVHRVVVLESAMPPMITAAALASAAGLAPELCAALVGYGVLASVVTLPAIARIAG
ncbi:MAG TPA: AEC family transporter [Polyangiaceae bacterium]|nr:AEC family transporter [Polyangiaceae bacterium]